MRPSRPALLLLPLIALAISGCIELEQDIVVMPDGSGMITLTIAQNTKAIKDTLSSMFGDQGFESNDDSPTDVDADEIWERCEGAAAISEVQRWEEDGVEYARFSIWFEDINEFRLYNEPDGSGEREVEAHYSWQPRGEGHVLVAHGDILGEMSMGDDAPGEGMPEDGEFGKQMATLMSTLMADAKFQVRFALPGTIESASAPFEVEDRTARFVIEGEELFDPEQQKSLQEEGPMEFVCGPSEIDAETKEEFAEAMAEAKARWSERLAEIEKENEARESALAAKREARDRALAEGKDAWTDDLEGIAIPDRPATGVLHGQDFVVEQAKISNGVLELRQGEDFFPDRGVVLFLFLDDGQEFDGLSVSIDAHGEGSRDNPTCHVHMKYQVDGKDLPETETFMSDFSMRIEFGDRSDDKIPGKIYLCLPDEDRSVIVGSFEAILE